jgi:hypothetical protein
VSLQVLSLLCLQAQDFISGFLSLVHLHHKAKFRYQEIMARGPHKALYLQKRLASRVTSYRRDHQHSRALQSTIGVLRNVASSQPNGLHFDKLWLTSKSSRLCSHSQHQQLIHSVRHDTSSSGHWKAQLQRNTSFCLVWSTGEDIYHVL